MSPPAVRAYVIGQTPRPDLLDDLQTRFPSIGFDVVGALDGVARETICTCVDCAYPLETRLRDGARIVVDAGYVESLLRRALGAYRGDAVAHLVLCAGPFPGLTAPAGRSGGPAPLIRPFDVAVEEFRRNGFHRLDVMVPFSGQADPALDKWSVRGFSCRTLVFTERPSDTDLPQWVAERIEGSDADALVFDYVGFPSEALGNVAARVGIPVFDLGHLAFDALEEILGMGGHR